MRVQLRRYPNRRYYDAGRSQHLTLEDIFRLICEGHQVQVNDSKSGEDITVRVLAQLILEQAPGKLAALPRNCCTRSSAPTSRCCGNSSISIFIALSRRLSNRNENWTGIAPGPGTEQGNGILHAALPGQSPIFSRRTGRR